MQSNNYWYTQGNVQYQGEDPELIPRGRHTADSVQNAHGLLAVYPTASATPSTHITRHLGSMSITSAPPSFMQPAYYSIHGSSYPPGNPPPYTEYAQEINYLATTPIPTNDSGYWENARNDAIRLLGEEARPHYPYPSPSHWTPSQTQTSHYHSNAFAQSVFQRTVPSVAYPTPPPGIMNSSSSLAFALGAPNSQHPPPVHQPKQSAQFFNNFLEQQVRNIKPETSDEAASTDPYRPCTPIQRTEPTSFESPDPLALKPSTPNMPTTSVTPLKRKPVIEIVSPSLKRQHVQLPVPNHRPSATPVTTRISSSLPPETPATACSTPSKTAVRRTATLAYIAVPPNPWHTPSSKRKASFIKPGGMETVDTPDLGGYGSEEGDPHSPPRSELFGDVAKSSSRRTGDRDERAPLEKLTALFEDIFEAEDSLPPDVDLSGLPSEFFSPLTVDTSRPLLSPAVIRKLTKYICQVGRPINRIRHGTTGAPNTPRSKGRMTEVETPTLSRLLKMLDRNVKAGEDLDPFLNMLLSSRERTASPRKPTAKKSGRSEQRRSRSRTPKDDDERHPDSILELSSSQQEVTEADYERLTGKLDMARDSVLAADCCIALLGSDRLTKQLYSEELITTCLNTIKTQLTKIIYPFVEVSADSGSDSFSSLLHYVVKANYPSTQTHRRQISEIFQAISAVLPRINNLINADLVAMSDAIIIQAVYIAIGPFFVVESTDGDTKGRKDNVVLRTFGKSAMRGLRLDALALIRSIFANHEEQRSWIIEEILSSLIRLSDAKQKAGQFKLRDGRSIRTVSALLLQLVQTSAHDVRLEARRISKSRQQSFALRRQESFTESQHTPEPFVDEHDLEEIRLYSSGLESAIKAAKTIVLFLTQRSGKGKATKSSNEAEYRTIFDNLISDLLVVLYWPEWPAASLLLSIATKFMVSSLDDVKSASQTDTNAAKTIALDHLGVIAARIRSSTLKIQHVQPEAGPKFKALKPLDEIVSAVNIRELVKVLNAHQDVATHLCKRSSEDQAYDSARELTAAVLGQELAAALKQINAWVTHSEEDDDLNIKDESQLVTFGNKLKAALRDVWKEHSTDVFDIGSQEEVARIDRLSEEIGTIQGLRNSFQPILNVILVALDAPPIFMRTKALRALGQIVTSDATILAAPNVRRAIESHLLDSSPAVRDAAVELIGKYMIDSPELASDYYGKIADRIADTGLGVRKRVIRLLKSFYGVTDDNRRRIDIATRLVLRMLDEDDSVKDLAVKSIEELWFQAPLLSSALKKPGSNLVVPHDKSPLLAKVSVIMGVAANFKDRQSPLEDMLHKIMADKQGSEAPSLHARYGEVCEALIDGLVDASDLPDFTVVNCVRTIHLFTSAYPAILSGSNASTLLPYLKNASTPEEQTTSDYLLKIFRVSIPHMPKTEAKFGSELQLALQPMIVKPSTGGGIAKQALQETVACMCAVVKHLTHDFARLVALLRSCNARLQEAIQRPSAKVMEASDYKALSVLIFIVSLLGEHCDFDQLRLDNNDLASQLDSIVKGSVIEHIYHSLLKLYRKYDQSALRGRILQCLGFLFRAQPTLMTMEDSATIMDAIFASPEEEGRGRLLKIMQDFLVSESSKHSATEKENAKHSKIGDVNMEELIGNTDGFADSGVSSAVVQRYLGHILDAVLSQNLHMQAAAIDILTFTVKQGLAHPLQSFPVIVALETSPNPLLSNRACALHSIVHSKHASLLNSRYILSARASFDYQRKLSSGNAQGFRIQPTPTALLQRWYSLVREKRPSRQEFLKSLIKVFEGDVSCKSSQDDVDFIRYMAENFASFDYKTQEEVLIILKSLTAVLSTNGTQLLETISPSHLLNQLREPTISQPSQAHVTMPNTGQVLHGFDNKIAIMRTSIIIGMVMLLKGYLKVLYGISEGKCVKFVIGKKSAVGDRPAVKRHDKPISWDRLPFATVPLRTSQDIEDQKSRFLDIWNEDGVSAEPEEDFQ